LPFFLEGLTRQAVSLQKVKQYAWWRSGKDNCTERYLIKFSKSTIVEIGDGCEPILRMLQLMAENYECAALCFMVWVSVPGYSSMAWDSTLY
jgi:hypothetical protein